jgi:hypothetical protein
MTEVQHRVDIMQMAIALTSNERNKDYGSPAVNHTNIAGLMNAYIQVRLSALPPGTPLVLDAEDAAMLMLCVKMARIGQRWGGQQTDSFVDGCAYIAIASECRQDRSKSQAEAPPLSKFNDVLKRVEENRT